MSLKKVHDIIKVFSKFNVYQRQLSFGQVGNLWPLYILQYRFIEYLYILQYTFIE